MELPSAEIGKAIGRAGCGKGQIRRSDLEILCSECLSDIRVRYLGLSLVCELAVHGEVWVEIIIWSLRHRDRI